MRRRSVIVGLLAAPLATIAHAQKRPRISILHSGFPNRTPIHLLVEALRALGYEDGSTATIELLGGEGNADRLNDLIAHLAAERPDIIIAITSPAVLGLKQAALPTPVVFLFLSEPVALGIVESAAHPGGNFTGITYSEASLGGKRLELLVDALPGTKRASAFSGAPIRRLPYSLRTSVDPAWCAGSRFSRAKSGIWRTSRPPLAMPGGTARKP
jgi:putative ABC transport system substrate-binding protein